MSYKLWLLTIAVQLIAVHGGTALDLDENFLNTWSAVSSGRMFQPKCVPIPENMTLCHNIGYDSMRIPNLLDHDNINEAMEQASNWNALVGIRCHPDTQVFLCSLFSPVCLDRIVYPCKSLCEEVQQKCEGYMKQYGFPWPDMFKCDDFPGDDDLCIPGPSDVEESKEVCAPCQEPDTYEGIIHNYCKTHYVIRATIKGLDSESKTAEPGEVEVLMGKRKKRFYKQNLFSPKSTSKKIYKQLAAKETKIYISQGTACKCDKRIVRGEHHLMGVRAETKYLITGEKVTRFYADFITSWNDEVGETKPGIKHALRAIRKIDKRTDNICDGGVATLKIHQEMEETNPDRDSRKQEKKERKQRRL